MDIKALTHTLTIAALDTRAALEAAQAEADTMDARARCMNAWTRTCEGNTSLTDEQVNRVYEANDRVQSRAEYAWDIVNQYHDIVEGLTGLLSDLSILESLAEHYEKIKEGRA